MLTISRSARRRVAAVALAAAGLVALPLAGGAEAGNGAPGGHDYQLNIIGVDNPKTTDMDDQNGRRIFVHLDGKSKINLEPGDFAVLDANGTDRDGATFQLPDPDVDGDGELDGSYSVYIRPLGTPGGSAKMTTSAEILELVEGEITKKETSTLEDGSVCSIESVEDELARAKGKSSFTNVTEQLTSILLEVEVDDQIIEVRIPLFDDQGEDYFWEYDNNGLRVAQVRFFFNDAA